MPAGVGLILCAGVRNLLIYESFCGNIGASGFDCFLTKSAFARTCAGIEVVMREKNVDFGAERRVYARYAVRVCAELAEAVAAPFSYKVCVVTDVSFGGAGVRSMSRFETGRKITLRAKLHGSGGNIELPGRIVRAVDAGDGWYEYGVMFENLEGAQTRRLMEGLECVARMK